MTAPHVQVWCDAFATFLARLNEVVAADYLGPTPDAYALDNVSRRKVLAEPQPTYSRNRYVRLFTNDGQRMCFGFVDRETGDVLKSGGWKAPAPKRKSIVDDNIYSATGGVSRARWTGIY